VKLVGHVPAPLEGGRGDTPVFLFTFSIPLRGCLFDSGIRWDPEGKALYALLFLIIPLQGIVA